MSSIFFSLSSRFFLLRYSNRQWIVEMSTAIIVLRDNLHYLMRLILASWSLRNDSDRFLRLYNVEMCCVIRV